MRSTVGGRGVADVSQGVGQQEVMGKAGDEVSKS